jgi:hypothetical protein
MLARSFRAIAPKKSLGARGPQASGQFRAAAPLNDKKTRVIDRKKGGLPTQLPTLVGNVQ